MTARDFYIYWIEFISQNCNLKADWLRYYNDNNLWTEFTIGVKCSEEVNSPFGDFLKNKSELRYRKEDGLIDLSFATTTNFNQVTSLHENKSERIEMIPQNAFYPIYYDILIEHENNIYHCYEEMIKLTYFRARLKVLVTYNENVDASSDYKYANYILAKNFKSVIIQGNKRYPENRDTEYLLIIGQLDNEKLIWYPYIFDYKGNIKHI